MGNNSSIEIIEKPNGIFDIKVGDHPNYPISYLRLCWDFDNKKYCIAETCDVESKSELHRKILVVGMNLPGIEKIHEQCFYLSSGINYIESLQTFFEKELIKNIDGIDADVWIPFGGFGYDNNAIKNEEDKNTEIKLLKNNFNCLKKGPECLYGRFGNKDPNLMNVSYCLGGKFWDNNIDIINGLGYDIYKLPNISSFFKDKIPCIFNYKKWSNIECALYLNKYIASALPYNYSNHLLFYKNRILKRFSKNKYFSWDDVKLDYRIIYMLKEKGLIKFTTLGFQTDLPFERTFTQEYWTNYILHINKLFKDDEKFFIEYIVPIINITIPTFNTKRIDEEEKEDVSYVIETI